MLGWRSTALKSTTSFASPATHPAADTKSGLISASASSRPISRSASRAANRRDLTAQFGGFVSNQFCQGFG